MRSVVAQRGPLLVADKPAGIPTLREAGFATSLVEAVARDLAVRAEDLHALNRLDVGVSGTVVLVLTQSSGERQHAPPFERRYLGIASAAPQPASGCWRVPIGRGPRGSWVVDGRDARPASTRYATVAIAPRPLRVPGAAPVAPALVAPALVAFELETGRTHQIRIHSSHAGAPLLGDPRYGGPRRFVSNEGSVTELSRIALHAARVTLGLQPPFSALSPVPEELRRLWDAFGGSTAAFEEALAATVPACE